MFYLTGWHYNDSAVIYNFLLKHRKLVLGIIVALVLFIILLYVFRSYPIPKAIYDFIIYWEVPVNTFVVLVLAYMAYISIAENRRIRDEDIKLNHKLKLLDEARDWARECVKYGFLQSRPGVKSQHEILQIASIYEDVAKNVDTASIVDEVFTSELGDPVSRAIGNLKRYGTEPPGCTYEEYAASFHEVLEVIKDLKKNLLSL